MSKVSELTYMIMVDIDDWLTHKIKPGQSIDDEDQETIDYLLALVRKRLGSYGARSYDLNANGKSIMERIEHNHKIAVALFWPQEG